MTPIGKPSRHRRAATVAAGAALVTIAAALPAAAHPSFANSAAAGFAPNPQGGTGAAGQAPPYAANTQYTLSLRLPDEVAANLPNGQDDNNVAAKVTVPAGWTNPTCDTEANGFGVRKSSTVNGVTNQLGAAIAGWTCTVADVTTSAGPRKQFQWSGPPAAAQADGAQFFSFKVTTPAVAGATSFGSLASALLPGFVTGEGFSSTQVYASHNATTTPPTGQIRHWFAPNAVDANACATQPPTGTPPVSAGCSFDVAGGLVRSVSPATGTPGYQTLTAIVPGAPAGSFSMSIPSNDGITLTRGTATTGPYTFTGALNRITVTDTRANRLGWELSGAASAFSGLESDSAKYLGWTPKVFLAGAGATAGSQVFNALDAAPGPGLQVAKRLAGATGTYDAGQASVGADLSLKLPRELPGGTYNTTLTVTAI